MQPNKINLIKTTFYCEASFLSILDQGVKSRRFEYLRARVELSWWAVWQAGKQEKGPEMQDSGRQDLNSKHSFNARKTSHKNNSNRNKTK